MIDLFRWFHAGTDPLAGAESEMFWAMTTIALSAVVAIGYGVIAVKWYFQSKLAQRPEARAALARLRGICLTCAVCGCVFFLIEMPWLAWRGYDLALLALGIRTWSFVHRMRGWSLVDARLAQVAELERSAARYREIAELLPHMVWTATADGRVDFSNQRWREYAGDDRSWLDAVHPEERDVATMQWETAIAAREPITLEARLGGGGGGYRTFVVNATPIARSDAVRWLGACADVEDQKLLAAQKEMQARQKSFFLNALSHDLRAPLHNVLLNAHLLKMSVSDEDGVQSVEMILENAVAAGDLVARLLDFAKVGAHEHNVLENVSVSATLHQIVRRFLPLTEQKGLSLQFTCAGDAEVMTDRLKLERIISNLVDNAIKYTERGGVTLELIVREAEVAVRICDTGMGIPEGNVPYLFDEFYQVNNYERDRSKGFGMGLAICRSLARHIGGEVRLAGTGPGGSCFEVVLRRLGADRGGRPLGPPRDHAAPEKTGVCRV